MSFRRIVVHGASEDRLQKLMTERLQAGADREAIDRRIWDLFGEEWCVMATDLSGFSRGVARRVSRGVRVAQSSRMFAANARCPPREV